MIDPEVCIDCGVCEPACPWEAIYQDTEVPEEFQQYIEMNARIVGQSEIESPRESKAQPTSQEVAENREKWLARFHQQREGMGGRSDEIIPLLAAASPRVVAELHYSGPFVQLLRAHTVRAASTLPAARQERITRREVTDV